MSRYIIVRAVRLDEVTSQPLEFSADVADADSVDEALDTARRSTQPGSDGRLVAFEVRASLGSGSPYFARAGDRLANHGEAHSTAKESADAQRGVW